MSLWQSILSKIQKGLSKMLGANTIESKLNVTVAISSEMEKAINLWNAMYRNKAPWLHEPDENDPIRIVSLGLPAMIASEKARTALIEFKSDITTPTETVEVPNPDYKNPPDTQLNEWGVEVPILVSPTIEKDQPKTDTARAEFLNKQYTKLKQHLRTQLEYGVALGGLIIKPYYTEMTISDEQEEMQEQQQEEPKKTNEQLRNEAVDKSAFPGKQAPEETEAGQEQNTEEMTQQQQVKKGPKVVPSIEYDFIRADCFYPLAFDANGNITEAAFVQPKVDKQYVYRRLEYHKWENNKLTIINKCYRSSNTASIENDSQGDFGKEVPLNEVPEWATLTPEIVINDVIKPLFAYFKMPDANVIDMTSPLGISGYARAISLIKDADMQYSRLLWEYEAGEMALNVDRDAFQWMAESDGDTDRGKSKLGAGQQRLYRQLDVNKEELFEPFAPSLRDANYVQGLNTILMRIEDVTGLSRGTLSDASSEAKTATELKILKQRSFQSNQDVQKALENALKDAIYATNALCDLYNITPPGLYDVNFEWDDSILVDVNEELNKRMALMQQGLMSKLELRQWYFGETERQAKEALEKIGQESAGDMENEMMGNFGANRFGQPSNRTFNFDKKQENPFEKKEEQEEKKFPFDKGGK